MALVEEGVRQRLRQRFSQLPEPVFDECLRTNPSNITQCITQLKQRSQAQERRDLMCGVTAGMEPAQPQHIPQAPPPTTHHQQHQHLQAARSVGSPDGRLNSDGWLEINWPPNMNAGGDKVDPQPSTTPEATEPNKGWQEYRDLYSFRPPLQTSKISVNLKDSGQRAKSPGLVQPYSGSPGRTYEASGNGNRTPGTPDSIGLESSIILPGLSPQPRDRTPSPSVNPFFPPIDHNALRASQSNGRSSPGVAYQYPPSASPRHIHSTQNTSTPQQPSHYNSPSVPVPGQPNMATSHPVTPHQRNTPEPRQDVRRKTSQPERWAEPYQPPRTEAGGVVGGVGASARHRSNTPTQQPYHASSSARPAPSGAESQEYRQRMGSQEELRYNQALITHQNARKERLRKDLSDEQAKLDRMRSEIRSMEQELHTKSSSRSHFPSTEQLSQLREEKRQLQIDIECMNKEIDLFKKQGFANPQNQEYFYANIEPGPSGPIPPGPPVLLDPVTPPVMDPDEGQQWSCTHCTFLNHPFLDKCECCEMPRDSA